MIFEYCEQPQFTKSIEIEDYGNTCIRSSTVDGFDYYIIIQTVMGKTRILTFGPIMADIDPNLRLEDRFNISYTKINFDMKKISRFIDQALNNPAKGVVIDFAEEIPLGFGLAQIPIIATAYINDEPE